MTTRCRDEPFAMLAFSGAAVSGAVVGLAGNQRRDSTCQRGDSPKRPHRVWGHGGTGSGNRGGRRGGRGSGRWGSDGDDGAPNGDRENDLDKILSQYSRTQESLANDVLRAWQSGSIDLSVVEQVLALEAVPLFGALLRRWPALRNRLVANSKFLMILAVEMAIGGFTKTLAETKTRGARFWQEFDFYISDMILELIGDFSLVWMLSPSFPMSSPSGSSGFMSGLPSHMMQVGPFSPIQRIAGFGYKAILFGLVGFAASMIGHSATVSLVKRRQSSKAQAGSAQEQVELAPVWENSVEWGKFMLVSSNFRYQFVGAVEQRLYERLLGSNLILSTAATFLTRLGNNYIGAVHWLRWAKATNLQG